MKIEMATAPLIQLQKYQVKKAIRRLSSRSRLVFDRFY